jgi:hypothetical protein
MLERSDEATLVQRALDGDESSTARLFRELEPGLRRFIGARIRGRSDIELDDVLQDVRVYLFRRLDRYNPQYPLAVFARGLAANIVKRHLYRRRDVAHVDNDEEWSADLSPHELDRLPQTLRDVLGDGRFGDPDGEQRPSRLFLETLEIFLREGGYPHQQVAFGYSILVWGRAKRKQQDAGFHKVPVTGDPGRVVREVGPQELAVASDGMLREIGEGARLDATFLARARQPLDRRLRTTVRDVFAGDATSARQFAGLAERITAQTELQQYFGRDPRKSVADWTRTVKLRVQRAIGCEK